jgi:nucleoside-diphosphate-sugar epimerase
MCATVYPPLPDADLAHAFAAVGEPGWHALAGRRLFVTGGTGFVGKWLLATLIDADRRLGLGCRVTVLSRDPAAFAVAAPQLAHAPGVDLVRGDVRDFEYPAGHFDTVIHAATDVVAKNSPGATFATCVEGTRRALDFATHSGAIDFLLVSSGAVYGRQPPELARMPETHGGAPDPLVPASAYGEGKRVSEWLACAQAAESSLRVKVARCFAFIGPYLPLDKHFAVGNFLHAAMTGGEIVIQGDGTPCRSYLHAADMAAWLWAVLLRGKPCTAYNVGGEESLSIADLAQRVVRALDSSTGVRRLQAAVAGRKPERYVPDVTRARSELDMPAPIPLDEALVRTALWHREQWSASS